MSPVSSSAYSEDLLKSNVQAVPLHDKVKELAAMIMQPTFAMWDAEDDKWVCLCFEIRGADASGLMVSNSAHLDAFCVHETMIPTFI